METSEASRIWTVGLSGSLRAEPWLDQEPCISIQSDYWSKSLWPGVAKKFKRTREIIDLKIDLIITLH